MPVSLSTYQVAASCVPRHSVPPVQYNVNMYCNSDLLRFCEHFGLGFRLELDMRPDGCLVIVT